MRLKDFVLLLVEDDPDEIVIVQKALAKANLVNPLRVVMDGEAALKYLKSTDRERNPRPSLILLDLRLPKRSGLEVLEWLRGEEELRQTPVVVLTGSTDQKDLDRALALGIKSWLPKPVRPDDLLTMVHSIGMYWLILHSRGPTDPAASGKRPGA